MQHALSGFVEHDPHHLISATRYSAAPIDLAGLIALDDRGAIVLRQKWSHSQVEARFANMPPCLIGMEACVGAHHLKSAAQSFRPRCQADAGEVRTAIFQGAEE